MTGVPDVCSSDLLSVFCWSVILFYCEDFTQWVRLDDWLVKVSWLGKLVLVFWCVELDFFSLECNGVSRSEFWDGSMCLVWLGSLCIDSLGYVPALLENLRGMSFSGPYWLLGGGWFQCRYGGFWMISYYLLFPVVRSSLMFSSFGLKSPASGFQSYSSSSLKTSPTIQHW